MRKPTPERFAVLQARVDAATEALSRARLSGASDHRIADLTSAVQDAQTRIQQEIASSGDPDTARGYARFAAEDPNRESKPASIGDRVAAATAQRREAQAARAARRRGTAA